MDIYLVAGILYVAALLGIGIYKSRSVKTQEDFMVAGRKTSWWMLAATLVCTWIGSGSLFGGAGLAFRMGFSELWMSAGAWLGILIVYFLAHKVRRIGEYTLSDILEKRYNPAARLLGTSAIILAYLTIAGYQFRGGGRLLNILTGIDPMIGGAIVCAIAVIFTIAAGLVSVIAIDLFNGIIMTIGVLVAIPLALSAVGGWETVSALPPERFAVFGSNDVVWAAGVFLPTLFLLLSEGSMYQKFFSAKDESTARKAVIGMIVGVVIIESSMCALSVIGSAKYIHLAPFVDAAGATDAATTETIVLHLARFDLPVWGGVLLICAAIAVILSTANSFLMIPATNVARDIYQRFINPSVTQEKIIRFQRMTIVILGIVAFVMASFFTTILAMAFTAYTMVGAGITPALLAAFLWKRVTVPGGVASIASGMGVTLIITLLNFILPEPVMEADYIILPAAGASLLALFVVSLLTQPSPEEKWKPFMTNMNRSTGT